MGNEKVFENKIKNHIRDKGGYCVKYHGNAFSTNGTPDILACINGYFLAVEVKAENGKPSELQLAKIRGIRKAGGFAYVVYPSGWNRLREIIEGLRVDVFIREEDMILR